MIDGLTAPLDGENRLIDWRIIHDSLLNNPNSLQAGGAIDFWS